MLRKPFRKPKQTPVDKSQVLLKVIGNAKQTGKLNLSSQQLVELPEALLKGEAKRSIDISFESSENNWWEVVELTKFIAADNLLNQLDPRISNFLALKVLDLHNNQISILPDEMGLLVELQLLNLNSNKLTALPDSICRLPLLELHLNDNQINFIPDAIDILGTLQVFNISGNNLAVLPNIPDASPNLTLLTTLNISLNQISDLSRFNLNRLTFLVDLSLAHNKITVFPPLNLSHLRILDLKYNSIQEFSAVLDCFDLKDLSLGFNRIVQFSPNCFSMCKALEVFDIRDNNLSKVPAEILQMYNLKRLDLSNNSISHLPPDLSLLKYLVAIHWSGNPLRGLPSTGGTAKLLEYLSLKLEVTPKKDNEKVLPYRPNANGSRIDWVNVNLKALRIEDIQESCDQPTSLNLSQNHISALPLDLSKFSGNLNR
jgi:Leucine-rich repeat (LRR) protein